MKPKTYEEWKKAGYYVIGGEKHSGRNEYGQCTFQKDQVAKQEERRVIYNNWDEDDDGRIPGEWFEECF